MAMVHVRGWVLPPETLSAAVCAVLVTLGRTLGRAFQAVVSPVSSLPQCLLNEKQRWTPTPRPSGGGLSSLGLQCCGRWSCPVPGSSLGRVEKAGFELGPLPESLDSSLPLSHCHPIAFHPPLPPPAALSVFGLRSRWLSPESRSQQPHTGCGGAGGRPGPGGLGG